MPESELAQSEDRFLGSLEREQASVPDVSYHLHWTRAGRDPSRGMLFCPRCSAAPDYGWAPQPTPQNRPAGSDGPSAASPAPPRSPAAPLLRLAPPAGPPQQRPRLDLSAEGQLGGGGGQGPERAGAQAVEHAPEAAPHRAGLEVWGESGRGVRVGGGAHPTASGQRSSRHGARSRLSGRQPAPGPEARDDWTAESRERRTT